MIFELSQIPPEISQEISKHNWASLKIWNFDENSLKFHSLCNVFEIKDQTWERKYVENVTQHVILHFPHISVNLLQLHTPFDRLGLRWKVWYHNRTSRHIFIRNNLKSKICIDNYRKLYTLICSQFSYKIIKNNWKFTEISCQNFWLVVDGGTLMPPTC